MFVYPIYKAIKARLAAQGPGFFFIGQYNKGKDNTSYRVPAIYIEMPKPTQLQFYGRKLLASKPVQIKIHYISHAPFKNHDNTVQDSALQAHEARIAAIDSLLTGWDVKDGNNKLLTQQFIPVAASMMTFMGENVVSVITYQTEIYSRHLQS